MGTGTPTPPTTPPSAALIDRLLAEAAALGEDARDELNSVRGEAGPGRLHARRELGTVVACLGYSVAWLLEQKAVAAGEIAAAAPPELAATLAGQPP
ncbi:MAG: hypothetical protein ACLFU0_09555, partial [Alphaproteobacteria bacterium]